MNHAIGALEVLMGQLIPTGYMVYAPNGKQLNLVTTRVVISSVLFRMG
jgi:hypothetical protein